jgi:hypothetical protein
MDYNYHLCCTGSKSDRADKRVYGIVRLDSMRFEQEFDSLDMSPSDFFQLAPILKCYRFLMTVFFRIDLHGRATGSHCHVYIGLQLFYHI